MPPLYEGDLLYMPTTFPGISSTKARELLQQTDRIIHSFAEVHHVFGKVGRAETATDPAPFDMIETTIMLKDEKDWPVVDIRNASGAVVAHRRRTSDELVDALNSAIQFPGLANAWTMPIKTRIDMLSTGIKTPVGIKIAGSQKAVVAECVIGPRSSLVGRECSRRELSPPLRRAGAGGASPGGEPARDVASLFRRHLPPEREHPGSHDHGAQIGLCASLPERRRCCGFRRAFSRSNRAAEPPLQSRSGPSR